MGEMPRIYDALDMKFLFAKEKISHLTPEKADLERLPELPSATKNLITDLVNDAKEVGRWFCLKGTGPSDELGRKLIIPYSINATPGWYGPSPELVQLLCS